MDHDYSINDFAKLAGVVLKEDATTSEGVGSAFVQGFKRGYSGDKSGSYAEPVDVNPEKKSASSSKRNPIRLAKAINGTDDQMLMRAINKIQTGTNLSRTEMIRITEAFKQILNMDRSQLRILMSALSQNAPQQTSQSSQNEEASFVANNKNPENDEELFKESLSLLKHYAGIMESYTGNPDIDHYIERINNAKRPGNRTEFRDGMEVIYALADDKKIRNIDIREIIKHVAGGDPGRMSRNALLQILNNHFRNRLPG